MSKAEPDDPPFLARVSSLHDDGSGFDGLTARVVWYGPRLAHDDYNPESMIVALTPLGMLQARQG